MKLLIERIEDTCTQTIGRMFVQDGKDCVKYSCHTLELPWKDNQQNISCIPEGEYKVEKRFSKKFKSHFHITNVEGRSYILIHPGNYYTDIRGCVLVGSGLTDINNDGHKDVINSGDTLADLLGLMPNKFNLKVTSI